MYNNQGDVQSVHDFASGLGMISWLGQGPDGCLSYTKYGSGAELRRICNTATVNLPPVAAASQSVLYGPSPLSVNFSSGGSSDPEGGPLTFNWNFGDGGTPIRVAESARTFTAPVGPPAMFTVTLTVTDNAGRPTGHQDLGRHLE
ncbi:MAG: PKD domain-containing protein [Flavobacteriales bacterium]|nr:PKD domain-containing protein [Flavobacteriales bacterium]